MKSGPYEIRAKSAGAELLIYGDIGENVWDPEASLTAKMVVAELNSVPSGPLAVRINSYGGSVSDGLAIYNALKRRGNVTTYVDGVALSIASLIAQAGDRIEMAENATMMIHGPQALAMGNAKTMREMADTLDLFARAMAPSYTGGGASEAEVLSLLTYGQDLWYTAAAAVAAGFATDTGPALAVAATYQDNRFAARAAPMWPAIFLPLNTLPGSWHWPVEPCERCEIDTPCDARRPPKLCRFIAPAKPLPIEVPDTSTN